MTLSRHLAVAAWTLTFTLTGSVHAQSSDAARIKELEAKLERSLQLIGELAAKVSRLEQQNAGERDAGAIRVQRAETKIQSIEKHISEISAGRAVPNEDGPPLHGFADVGLVRNSEDNASAKGRKGATVGSLDLYLTPRFGDRVRSLIELAFEAEHHGEVAVELERLQVGYSFGDAAVAWLGRFHTPYGYWNTAFHHGAQIQTSILRPAFLEFEEHGGVLPAHTVGAWLTGVTTRDGGRFGYDLYAGNAPQIHDTAAGPGAGKLDMRQTGSTGHRTSVGFNAWFEPGHFEGLRLGAHGLRADVADDAAMPNRTLLKLLGGYFAYSAEPWEALGEYYRFDNEERNAGGASHSSWAGYAQLGYLINRWTLYGRAERAHLDATDPYFAALSGGRSYKRLAAGLRYDIDPKAALKAEFASTRKEIGPGLADRYPELRVQYAIRF